MAYPPQSLACTPEICVTCTAIYLPAPENHGMCLACHHALHDVPAQFRVGQHFAQSFPSYSPEVQAGLQQGSFTKAPSSADWTDWYERAKVMTRQQELHAQEHQELEADFYALQHMFGCSPHDYTAQAAPTSSLAHAPAYFGAFNNFDNSQALLHRSADINANLMAANYEPAMGSQSNAHFGRHIRHDTQAGRIAFPVAKPKPFSPHSGLATSRASPFPTLGNGQMTANMVYQQRVQQDSSGQKRAGNMVSATRHGSRDGTAAMQARRFEKTEARKNGDHARRGSHGLPIGLDGASYIVGGNASNVSSGISSQPLFGTPPQKGASSSSTPTRALGTANFDHDAQLAAVASQINHEAQVRALHSQTAYGAYHRPANKLPTEGRTSRLTCPDCKQDKPVNKKLNDGIHCTMCFNKRIKQGKALETIVERETRQQLEGEHQSTTAPPRLALLAQAQPRTLDMTATLSPASQQVPYELDLATRRAMQASGSPVQSPNMQARQAQVSQQSVLMGQFSQASSSIPLPLPTGSSQGLQPVISPPPSLRHCSTPINVAPSTPKRNHEAAFSTVGLDINSRSPLSSTSALSTGNKRSRPSPRAQLEKSHATLQDTRVAAEAPRSASTAQQSTSILDLSEFRPSPELPTHPPSTPPAADGLQMLHMSNGCSSGSSLAELEDFLIRFLPIEIAKLDSRSPKPAANSKSDQKVLDHWGKYSVVVGR